MNIHRNNDYIQLHGRETTTLTCLRVFSDIKNNNSGKLIVISP